MSFVIRLNLLRNYSAPIKLSWEDTVPVLVSHLCLLFRGQQHYMSFANLPNWAKLTGIQLIGIN